MFVRLPVVVQTIAALRSKKSFGVVPHSMTPPGMTLCFADRSTQYCSASIEPGLSKYVSVPASFIRIVSLGVVSPWKSQYGNPDDGIFTPHGDTLPLASVVVSFCAYETISFQLSGALSGSRPASWNSSLFQYITIVERWNGTPQVLPPVRLF